MMKNFSSPADNTDAADQPVIRICDLHKSYGKTEVLKGIDLEVARGEVVVVLGPSGSGKSTMLRCVNLLEEPTSGHVWFEDTEITAKGTNINKIRTWAWCFRTSTCSPTSPPRKTSCWRNARSWAAALRRPAP